MWQLSSFKFEQHEQQQWATGPQYHTALTIYCACLSGHWVATAVFALITPHITSKDDWTKIEDISNLINIYHTNSIQVLNLHGFLYRFWLCLQTIPWKLITKLVLVLGSPFRDRKCLGTKQTQVKTNANRDRSIKLDNHIQPQLNRWCPKSSWSPTSQNADGAPHTGDFNTMYMNLNTI